MDNYHQDIQKTTLYSFWEILQRIIEMGSSSCSSGRGQSFSNSKANASNSDIVRP